jgi:hypothetical protein
MVNSLNGSHSLVEMVKVTDPTVRENICGLINEYLSDRNKREMFDPAIINLNLMLWQQNNDMPVELKEQINSCFKDLILDKIIGDLGSYLGGNRQAQLAKLEPLFEQALNEVRISKKLQQELQKFDLSQISNPGLYAALCNNKLPRVILTPNRGYVNILDYIRSETPGKLNTILEIDVKENKLMDLIGNRFDKLVYLEPETIRAFLVKFSPQKDKTIATYIDSDGYTALHWAAHQGNWEAIKALAEAFPTPNPNITNKHGDTPLILALKNKLDLRASRMFGKSSKSFTRKM